MSRGRFDKPQSKHFPWLLIIAVVVLFAVFVLLILKGCNGAPALKQEGGADPTATTVEKNPNSIAIPGYEMLELKAGSKEQSLCMPNPPQNCCYFQICLYMEDGTLLWESELIEPGKTSKPIVLSKALEKGMYPNAVLRYSCYRMDENLSPLNGAETKLTLWVK
ncbi:MAG: tRNA (uracil-5-)-methyltransferase [Ruminococcaceae bacterium]|nr:tRNA (uracil-5-)-methyltransferase [Oscillospiraceae bacterium]